MNIIYLILGLNVYLVFILKREWLLKVKPFISLLILNCLLFVIAHVLGYYKIGNPNFVAALKIPAPQQLLFYVLLIIYKAIFNADPQDTLWSMDWKMMKDGVFNFIFIVASAVPTILARDNII